MKVSDNPLFFRRRTSPPRRTVVHSSPYAVTGYCEVAFGGGAGAAAPLRTDQMAGVGHSIASLHFIQIWTYTFNRLLTNSRRAHILQISCKHPYVMRLFIARFSGCELRNLERKRAKRGGTRADQPDADP